MDKNIIIISSVDWNDNFQMHHQLTKSFESEGYNVLFIENTGVRSLKIIDIKRIFSRLFNWFKYSRGFKKNSNLVNILSPIILPFPFLSIAIFLNTLILKRSINNYLLFKNINNYSLITFLPSPLVLNLLKKIKPISVYYYCANDMTYGSLNKKKLIKSELEIFKKSNSVFTISEKLYDKAVKANNNVYFFPPGVDFKKFNIAFNNNTYISKLKNIREPIIGYIGSISKVFDFNLMLNISDKFNNSKIVIIGKIYENSQKLKKLISKNNVIFIDQVPHSELPRYIKYFKIGLIPYLVNDFTNSVSACKLNEYLSLGIPVVSTNIAEVNNFNKKNKNIIFTDKNNINLIKIIDKILKNTININKQLYIETAKKNDWDNRYKNISKIVTNNFKEPDYNDWNQEFSKYIKNFWNKILKYTTILILIFVIIFKSPLFWLIGNSLVIQEQTVKSSAIVVFSGNGKSGYTNTGYQNRALEAVDLYKKGLADKIILTSGRLQTISEGELISAYLVSKGINKNQLILIEQYPVSTFDNVKIASNYLKKNNINDIILLTAPYHTKRANLIWNKVSPEIKVNFPTSNEYQKNKIKWSFKLNEIKIIIYEILAIIHNKYNNYL